MASKFLKNASFYGSASVYSVIVGLISFPILTRLFDVADYGLMGLVSATIPAVVGIGKLGLQHASLRFYAEVKNGDSRWQMPEYYSTLFLSMLVSSFLIWLVGNAVLSSLGQAMFTQEVLPQLLAIGTYLVATRVLESGVLNVFSAREQASRYSQYIICKRTLVLISTVAVLTLWRVDLVLYFITLVTIETAVLVYFALSYMPLKDIRPGNFRYPLLTAMLGFGIPMFGMEFCAAMINISDRYIINAFLGNEPLGMYSSAYTLVEYAQGIITLALAASALPMFLRINEQEGQAAAEKFINDALRMYYVIAIPLVLMMAAAGEPVLSFLAGEKYRDGAVIMPWVAAGMALHGAFVLIASGLYLRKKTGVMFRLLLATAIANIVLNIIAVPRFGILGAAVTSLVCYVGCTIGAYHLSRRYVNVQVPWASVGRACIAGGLMYASLQFYAPSQPFLDLVFKFAVAGCVYVGVISAIDKEVRQGLSQLIRPLLAKFT